METPKNPEELHDMANTSKRVSDKFVSPGMPAAALASESDMPQAKQKAGTEKLRGNLYNPNK